jgi:hypothetical protein
MSKDSEPGFRWFFGGMLARINSRTVDPSDDLRAAAKADREDDFAEQRLIEAERRDAERRDAKGSRFR